MKILVKRESVGEYREGKKIEDIVDSQKRQHMTTPKTKTCTGCKIEKPLTAFRRANESPDGRHSRCKACQKAEYEQQKAQQAEYAKNYFTFSFALLFSLTAFSQCDRSAFVFNLTPGVTQSGAWFSMEAGIWPVQGKLGVTAGPAMYDEKITTAKGNERLTEIDFIGRVIYKLTATGSDRPQLITLFGTVRGLYGASYRAYWSIGENQLLGVEPVVSRVGVGVNLIFTARL